MNSNRCRDCGLVNFASAAECKRCGAPLPAAGGEAGAYGPEPPERRAPDAAAAPRARRSGLLLVGLFAALAAGAAGVLLFGRTGPPPPSFARMIQDSEEFKAPLIIKVNREQLREGMMLFDRPAVPEAYALEALGLLDLNTRETQVEVKPGRPHLVSAREPEPVYETKISVDIALTAEGREAAAGWEVLEEGAGPHRTTWWRIPVGGREFVSVESDKPWARYDREKETRIVHFKWLWKPNALGEGFDRHNPRSRSLPEEARGAAFARQDSTRPHDGVATFERRAGGWELVEVFFSAVHDPYTGTYMPVVDTDGDGL